MTDKSRLQGTPLGLMTLGELAQVPDRLADSKTAARLLGLQEQTLRAWACGARQASIAPVRTAWGLRWRVGDLLAMMSAKRQA